MESTKIRLRYQIDYLLEAALLLPPNLMPSKQSSPSLFKPHGEVSFDMDGQILTVHMHGHWNLEMRDKAAEDLLTHIQALGSRGPWAIINCLHDTVVYSEEIFAATRNDYAARPASSQLTAVAFVIAPQVEGAVLLTRRFEQLLNGIITSQVFANLDSAKTWARDQIR